MRLRTTLRSRADRLPGNAASPDPLDGSARESNRDLPARLLKLLAGLAILAAVTIAAPDPAAATTAGKIPACGNCSPQVLGGGPAAVASDRTPACGNCVDLAEGDRPDSPVKPCSVCAPSSDQVDDGPPGTCLDCRLHLAGGGDPHTMPGSSPCPSCSPAGGQVDAGPPGGCPDCAPAVAGGGDPGALGNQLDNGPGACPDCRPQLTGGGDPGAPSPRLDPANGGCADCRARAAVDEGIVTIGDRCPGCPWQEADGAGPSDPQVNPSIPTCPSCRPEVAGGGDPGALGSQLDDGPGVCPDCRPQLTGGGDPGVSGGLPSDPEINPGKPTCSLCQQALVRAGDTGG